MANFNPGQDFYVYTIDDWITFASYTQSFDTLTHVYIMNDIDFSTYVDGYGHPINCPNFYRSQKSRVFIHGNGHTISNMYFCDLSTRFSMLCPNNYVNDAVSISVEHLTIKDFFIECSAISFTYFWSNTNASLNKEDMSVNDYNLFGVVHTINESEAIDSGTRAFAPCKYIKFCQIDLKWISSDSNTRVVLLPTHDTVIDRNYIKLTLIGYHGGFYFGGLRFTGGYHYAPSYVYVTNCIIELHLENLQPGSNVGMMSGTTRDDGVLPYSLLVLIESAPRDMTNTHIYICGKQTSGRLTFYDKTKTDALGITISTHKAGVDAIGETTEHLKDGVYMYENYGLTSD